MERWIWIAGMRSGVAVLAIALAASTGCAENWRTNGRFWRQPLPAATGTSNSFTAGRAGYSKQSGVGPGLYVSGEWGEDGGSNASRAGTSMTAGVHRNTTAKPGIVPDAGHSGRLSESVKRSGTSGHTARSGEWGEISKRTGVGG